MGNSTEDIRDSLLKLAGGTASPLPSNTSQVGGVPVAVGAGASSTGTPRVILASDSALAPNQSVNVAQIGGVAPNVAAGVVATGTLRTIEARGVSTAVSAIDGTTLNAAQALFSQSNTRLGAIVQNDSTKTIILRAGSSGITTTAFSLSLAPGARYDFPKEFVALAWQVMASDGAAGTGSVRVTAVAQ